MELSDLTTFTLDLFNAQNIEELKNNIKLVCIKNKEEVFAKFKNKVKDLGIDWLQKIFQYYLADRKEKMQDYTPLSLAKLTAVLAGENDKIIDMCAGSGALTIQYWNINKDTEFLCYELDENVIPFLIFNLMLRNIKATVIRKDILSGIEKEKYIIERGEEFGKCKCN